MGRRRVGTVCSTVALAQPNRIYLRILFAIHLLSCYFKFFNLLFFTVACRLFSCIIYFLSSASSSVASQRLKSYFFSKDWSVKILSILLFFTFSSEIEFGQNQPCSNSSSLKPVPFTWAVSSFNMYGASQSRAAPCGVCAFELGPLLLRGYGVLMQLRITRP